MKKELNELLKASGMLLGEVHEVTKDGVGLEDLKSLKDLLENKEVLMEGFKGLKDLNVAGMEMEEMMGALLALKEGFDLGAK